MSKQTRRFNVSSKYIVSLLLILGCISEGFTEEIAFKGPYDDKIVEQRDARMAWWRETGWGRVPDKDLSRRLRFSHLSAKNSNDCFGEKRPFAIVYKKSLQNIIPCIT